ncbi:MAG TPA: ABC transporter substrate-binding protein [Candidatus Binatia bacterium]|nr:ABC transporter substrate-binding protein [Candidatus Binatia bacterium]
MSQRWEPPPAILTNFAAFQRGLHDLGYIEGKNILIEHRSVEGRADRISSLVREMVQVRVDVIVSAMSAAIEAAKQATTTIPIVMIAARDPVRARFVASLAHPSGNITGVTRVTEELAGKRLELLTEAFPQRTRIGVLQEMSSVTSRAAFNDYETAAHALNLTVHMLSVRLHNLDFERAFQEGAAERVNALITITTPLFVRHARRITELAIKKRMPSMFEGSEYAEADGLMSYSGNDAETFRRAATYVDKILKGVKPADLPIEQPKKFELVINLGTAKQIGLTIPPNVLARADRVIR